LVDFYINKIKCQPITFYFILWKTRILLTHLANKNMAKQRRKVTKNYKLHMNQTDLTHFIVKSISRQVKQNINSWKKIITMQLIQFFYELGQIIRYMVIFSVNICKILRKKKVLKTTVRDVIVIYDKISLLYIVLNQLRALPSQL
jgi:hypothetical protein